MRKVMFNDRFMLTQAVLVGRKTQTRRIIPLTYQDEEYLDYAFDFDLRESVIIDYYARYKIGEIVAVAQSYHDAGIQFIPIQDKVLRGKSSKSKWGNAAKLPGWYNKQLTRADLMPHQIKIINIKIERLQDISDEDCLKEGVFLHQCSEHKSIATINDNKTEEWYRLFDTVREAYAYMIDAISGKGTWDSNPYVFVYDFKLIK